MLRRPAPQFSPARGLSRLDFFPKDEERVQARAPLGALATIIGLLALAALGAREAADHLAAPLAAPRHSLAVDNGPEGGGLPRDAPVAITLQITFLELPCDAISIDATDSSGEATYGVKNGIEKLPWRGGAALPGVAAAAAVEQGGDSGDVDTQLGRERGRRAEDMILGRRRGRMDLGTPRRAREMWERMKAIAHADEAGGTRPGGARAGECLPCYGAALGAESAVPADRALDEFRRCCNNCFALRRAYSIAHLPQEDAAALPQCAPPVEGCMLKGVLEVQRVPGNFHIGVGETHGALGQASHHHHWPPAFRGAGFNTTHHIAQLSFGEQFPGQENPLDDFWFVERDIAGQQQYHIDVVPTRYDPGGGRPVVLSNQYAVTRHHTTIDVRKPTWLPGVFFKYDISPLIIHIEPNVRPLSHLLTRLCALVGGTWVVIGLVYRALSFALERLRAARRRA